MKSVLLIDDDVELGERLGDFFPLQGFVIVSMQDAVEGVKQALSQPKAKNKTHCGDYPGIGLVPILPVQSLAPTVKVITGMPSTVTTPEITFALPRRERPGGAHHDRGRADSKVPGEPFAKR